MVILASTFLILGSLFALIATIGLVRMPDLYCRMHAATKAGAFGVSLMLLGLICVMPSLRVIIQSVMIILFFYLTAPLAGHMIGRVAVRKGVALWKAPKEGKTSKTDSERSSVDKAKDSQALA